MTLRCPWLVLTLGLGCTDANPEFDAGTGSKGGTADDDASSTGRPQTGDATAEGTTTLTASEDTGSPASSETSDTDST